MKHHTFEDGLKYKPDYKWPKPGTDFVRINLLTTVNLGGAISVSGNFLKKTLKQ